MKKLLIILSIAAISTSVYSKAPERSLKSAFSTAYKLLTGKTEVSKDYREALREGLVKRETKLARIQDELNFIQGQLGDIETNKYKSNASASLLIPMLLEKVKADRNFREAEQDLEDYISVIEGFDPSILD